jgi:hypothetical protein
MSLTLAAVLGALDCRREHESPVLVRPAGSPGSHVVVRRDKGIDVEQTEEPVELVERVAALDIGKATVTACVGSRTTSQGGAARRSASTPRWCAGCWTGRLAAQPERSAGGDAGHQRYWKPLFYLLEAEGLSPAGCWAPSTPRNVPGRPKTDKLDAVWLATLARAGQVLAEPGASQADPPPARPRPLPA